MGALLSELEAEGYIMPEYGRSNLEVARQLARGTGEFVGESERKVVVVLDGFGYNLVDGIIRKEGMATELLRKAAVKRITSLFPTITPNVLTSMYSGSTPAEHGVLGTAMPLSSGEIINVMKWKPFYSKSAAELADDPAGLYPRPKLMQQMGAERGMVVLYSEHFIGSKVSQALLSGCESRGFVSFDDMFVAAKRLVEEGKHRYIYAYNDVIDRVGHVYSNNSEHMRATLVSLLSSIDRILLPVLKKNGYDLVITADHGQIDTGADKTVRIDGKSDIARYLEMPLWCEKRLRIAKVRPGGERGFAECFERDYGRFGRIIESDEAIRSGIFGAGGVPAERRYLFGTHLILPKSDYMFAYDPDGHDTPLRQLSGQHGGLSADEMYIPAILY